MGEAPVPRPIEMELGEELETLRALGYRVDGAHYDAAAFGNWYVDFEGRRRFRVIKDRQQYFVDGDQLSLERFGLWRAFDDFDVFAAALLRWAAEQ